MKIINSFFFEDLFNLLLIGVVIKKIVNIVVNDLLYVIMLRGGL